MYGLNKPVNKCIMKDFIKFALVWYSQQMAIPFWVIGHFHLSLNGAEEDAVMPIPVFYDPKTGKILVDTLPPDLREEYKDYTIA